MKTDTTKKISIEKLKTGDLFKLDNQMTFRVFSKLIKLNHPLDEGKYLLIFNGCRQMLLNPETKVTVQL